MAGRLDTRDNRDSSLSAIVEGAVVVGDPDCSALSLRTSSLRCDRAKKVGGGRCPWPGAVLGLRRLFSHDLGLAVAPLRDCGLESFSFFLDAAGESATREWGVVGVGGMEDVFKMPLGDPGADCSAFTASFMTLPRQRS